MIGSSLKTLLTASLFLGIGLLSNLGRADTAASQPTTTPTTQKVEHTITIAAAADLKFAFEDLKKQYQLQHPNIEIKVTYGSSGNFFTQLVNQAPFDIFLSADMQYPEKLAAQELVIKDTAFKYAQGKVVLWLRKDSPLAQEPLNLDLLKDARIKKIAIANPKHAPYGRAAEAALKKLAVYEQVKDKLVLGENIAQTAQFVDTGAADAGFLALSLALSPTMKAHGNYWALPADSYPAMDQEGIILKWAKDPKACHDLVKFMQSDAAQTTLKLYGFTIPEKKKD